MESNFPQAFFSPAEGSELFVTAEEGWVFWNSDLAVGSLCVLSGGDQY